MNQVRTLVVAHVTAATAGLVTFLVFGHTRVAGSGAHDRRRGGDPPAGRALAARASQRLTLAVRGRPGHPDGRLAIGVGHPSRRQHPPGSPIPVISSTARSDLRSPVAPQVGSASV
ncbi:MAG: hypothetical protein M3O34_20515 [Chloroflexota bacterium]|nr:hypothetical protein [Chloroflexota bacterium]